MKIMLGAASSPQAVGIIKHLKLLGHHVIGHDCCPYGAGAIFADEWFVSPPVSSGAAYAEFLDRVPHDLYLPFLDEEIRLHPMGKMLSSPYEACQTFTSKISQQVAFDAAGLPVASADESPSICKPDRGRGGKGVFAITDPIIARQLRHRGDYFVQKFIEGDEYTVDVLTDMTGYFIFAVPRLRIATAGGVSTIGKIKMDDELIGLARQVVGHFRFAGPINIQMIREKDTRKVYIIELNPRLSGSCMFTVIAGWDILADTVKVWKGEKVVPPKKVWDVHVRRYYTEVKL